jgi:hypothetical protein
MERLRERFQHEANQCILKNDFLQGNVCLGRMDGLDRLRSEILFHMHVRELAPGIPEKRIAGKNHVRVLRGK